MGINERRESNECCVSYIPTEHMFHKSITKYTHNIYMYIHIRENFDLQIVDYNCTHTCVTCVVHILGVCEIRSHEFIRGG